MRKASPAISESAVLLSDAVLLSESAVVQTKRNHGQSATSKSQGLPGTAAQVHSDDAASKIACAAGVGLASCKTLGIGKRADDYCQYRFLAWK